MRPFIKMWIFVGCVTMASALPFAGCIGDSSTGALSQSLTDDGGTAAGVDMSTTAHPAGRSNQAAYSGGG